MAIHHPRVEGWKRDLRLAIGTHEPKRVDGYSEQDGFYLRDFKLEIDAPRFLNPRR
jgi:hypothetical protein